MAENACSPPTGSEQAEPTQCRLGSWRRRSPARSAGIRRPRGTRPGRAAARCRRGAARATSIRGPVPPSRWRLGAQRFGSKRRPCDRRFAPAREVGPRDHALHEHGDQDAVAVVGAEPAVPEDPRPRWTHEARRRGPYDLAEYRRVGTGIVGRGALHEYVPRPGRKTMLASVVRERDTRVLLDPIELAPKAERRRERNRPGVSVTNADRRHRVTTAPPAGVTYASAAVRSPAMISSSASDHMARPYPKIPRTTWPAPIDAPGADRSACRVRPPRSWSFPD